MTGLLDDTDTVRELMQSIGEACHHHLGFVPDAVLILRAPDGQCRTLFAAGAATLERAADMRDVRRAMSEVLEQGAKQNRAVNKRYSKPVHVDWGPPQ